MEERIQKHDDAPFALFAYDIDNLKLINDTYAHAVGDEMIIQASQIVKDAFLNYPVYCIRGDEFVVIMDHHKEVRNHSSTLPLNVQVSIACGVGIYDHTLNQTYRDVFHRADQEMYVDKANFKNGVVNKENINR